MLESNVLNMELAERQGLTQAEVDALEHLHFMKDELFKGAEGVERRPDFYDAAAKRGVVLALEQLEFSMQRLWKFEENSAYHTWWYRLPGCACPKLDNRDNFGCEERIYDRACPFHGGSRDEGV